MAGDELAGAITAENIRAGKPPAAAKADLFREFILKWREILDANSRPRPFSSAEYVRSLGPPPSEARLVLLLNDICGLSQRDIEYVLDPLSKPFAELLKEGRAVIARQREERKALIVEDEPLIAADLKDVLENMGVTVVGLARTADQGAREALKSAPDIVLADYNLDGQKTGVDAVIAFQDSHQCPVIFITGYPDDVLKGEDVEPDFVIVKPYRPEAVQAAVAHCLDTERFFAIDADSANGDL
ncbi:response regulator [Hyphococcus sp.]|uniref:response regulator n=1 Tax=Hyphococcus sp. TaxID=2038636 RepID=UPI0035C75F70